MTSSAGNQPAQTDGKLISVGDANEFIDSPNTIISGPLEACGVIKETITGIEAVDEFSLNFFAANSGNLLENPFNRVSEISNSISGSEAAQTSVSNNNREYSLNISDSTLVSEGGISLINGTGSGYVDSQYLWYGENKQGTYAFDAAHAPISTDLSSDLAVNFILRDTAKKSLREEEVKESLVAESEEVTTFSGQTEASNTFELGPFDMSGTASAEDDSNNDNGTSTASLGSNFESTAVAGRVKTFELEDDTIESVKVISGPEYGNVTVNPDNTLAVVLSGTTKTSDLSFRIETTHTDGSVTTHKVNLDVTEGPQGGGWGVGNVYMLETDKNDNLVIEHGENHQKVYVSGSDDALTLADIAAIEGKPIDKITQSFLANHAEYGRSEDMALAEDAGTRLWKGLTGEGKAPSSNWLLIERGYDYEKIGHAIENGTKGESEINPIYIGAYGDGETPVINVRPTITGEGVENVVIQNVHFTRGFASLSSDNLLFDQTVFTGKEVNIQNAEGFTLHNSAIYDATDSAPKNGETWSPHGDRESGIFVTKSSGILIEGSFFDHNGWEEGYDPSGDGDSGQTPSMFSHNVYLQKTNLDVTFHDNISMRAASFGAQIRSGGFIEDNVFIDNNAGVNFLRGADKQTDEANGNYALFADNVITSGAHKTSDAGQGALTLGVSAVTEMSVLVDNIVAHLADPNNPDELTYKTITHDPIKYGEQADIIYDDTITYNWAAAEKYDVKIVSNNTNVEGLDTNVLDKTTIQLFTAQLLGKETATIEDLANYLRAQADGQLDHVVDADLIIDFFQTGFGIAPDIRAEAETLRFIPNDLGDGVRWDNRLNWNTEDLPGTQDGDSVNLAGNWVQYGGTTTLEDLNFGDGGKLSVTHGHLQIDDHIAVGDAGAELNIDNAGQFWTDGYTDQDLLTINVAGGRFANTDLFAGRAELNISDNAQAILASDGADYVVNDNSSISITGGDVKVGFDGDQGGTGVLLFSDKSQLSFTAEDGDMGQIREFYSGHYQGTAPDIQSGVNLGDTELVLDLTEIAGGAAVKDTLINVDEIIGNFGSISVVGLGSNQNAKITVDYEQDTVVLSLGAAGKGNGSISLDTAGNEADAQENADLWAALTNGHGIYPEDRPEDIPEEEDVVDI